MLLQEIENYQAVAKDCLSQICAACAATSVWLLKHDFKKRVATVVAESISEAANNTERIGDIGEVFPEGTNSSVWQWLHGDNPQPYEVQVADLPAEQLGALEYIEDNVQSVIFFVVRVDNRIWGFVEVWDTRTPRPFTAEQLAAAQAHVHALELALVSL